MTKPSQREILEDLGVGNIGGASGDVPASLPNMSAQELGNDPAMEEMWAMRAMEHADMFFNLLCAVDPRHLNITQKDDMIYKLFREEFPDFKVHTLDEDSLKSASAKEKWRTFCEKFAKEITDFNFATLVRISCDDEYSEQNTILVTRIQFFCIEIARNREGHNDSLRINFKPRTKTKMG